MVAAQRINEPRDEATQADKVAHFDLLSAPGHLLRRNHQRSFEIFQKHVGDGITRQQFALLLALSQRPGASQKDLVAATGIDKSTLKEMLGRMVPRQWVARERDPNDSRAWTIQITEDGQRILTDYIDKAEAAQREILAPLAPADRALFMHFLRTLLGKEEEKRPQ